MRDALSAYGRTLRVLAGVAPLQSALVLLCVLVAAGQPVANYALVLHLVNAITGAVGHPAWWRAVAPWLGLLVGLRLLAACGSAGEQWATADLRERIDVWLNEGIIRRAVAADLAQAQSGPYQDGLSRASGVSGLDMINILGDMTQSLQHMLGALSLSAVLWRYGPAVPLLPLCGGVARWLREQRFAADLYEWDREHTRPRRRRDALAGLLTDRTAAKEVRLYQAGPDWVARWRRSWVELQEGRQAKERRRFAARTGLDVLGALLYGGALVALLARILHGGMTIGAYVAGAASLVEVEGMWNWAANHANWLADAMRHMRGDLFAFLDANPVAPPPPPPRVPSAAADLELEGVGFTYPGAPAPALSDVTLRIPAGQRVGVVGPNGAGKTTLARILLGLYLPTEGTVRAGGLALDPAAREAWWRQCSAVFQDFTRYDLTARENVAFGDLDRPERLAQAAEAAEAAAVVAELPQGYDTTVGPTFGGRDLSGGQWQRLATARGFMPEAALIVLDEPAAALDPLAELGVYMRFAALTRGRTAVLISHRLASARQCDRILVLDGGRIVEDGTHEELTARGGLYAELFAAQAQWYVDGAAAAGGGGL